MEVTPGVVGRTQGRRGVGKEAQVIKKGEERQEPTRAGHP